MRNIFASVRVGTLADVIQINITDELSLMKELEEEFGEIGDRLYGWFKEREEFDVFPCTTTMGNPDLDYLNWYAVLDREGILIIVNRKDYVSGEVE